MNVLAAIIGVGIVAFGFLYLATTIESKDVRGLKALKYFFQVCFLMFLIFIPVLIMEDYDHCSFEVANITTATIGGNSTDLYEYDYVCIANSNTTDNTLWQLFTRVLEVIGIFVTIFIFLYVMLWLIDLLKQRFG